MGDDDRVMRRITAALVVLATCSACATSRTGAGTSSSAAKLTAPAATSTSSSTLAVTTSAVATAPATRVDPPQIEHYEVVIVDGEVLDTARNRRIPYRVYAPAGPSGKVPIILVSHGGDGNARGYLSAPHLGTTFAAGGFVAIHIGHLPSANALVHQNDRPADVTFLLDQLAAGRVAMPVGFVGTPDLDRVGHTGHSYGAYTSHAVAGATYRRTHTDPRIDAIAPISPQGPDQFGAFDRGPTDSTWTTVTVPVYDLVGGDEVDSNAVDSLSRPGWRLVPFDRYQGTADTFLSIIDGQVHSDMWNTGSADVEQFIATQILAFMQRYVAGDGRVDACSIGVSTAVAVTTRHRAGSAASALAGCSS
jgi:poly(3-hydroxybutyrate) depolymerase